MIGGKQITVYRHVGNLKISYVNTNKVTKLIQWLESEYGEMHGSRRKRNDYLGMSLDYSITGEVRISMEEYLRGVLNDLPEKIIETPETPTTSNLFNFREDSERELLDKTRAHAFHHTVAQLLLTRIRFRKDTQTAIAFLLTRMRKPDKDYWKKLTISLSYLKRTIKLPLLLQADRVNVLKWSVDESYAAHDDMRGHIGGTMAMGKDGHGSIIIISKKQKLNTRSLTEA